MKTECMYCLNDDRCDIKGRYMTLKNVISTAFKIELMPSERDNFKQYVTCQKYRSNYLAENRYLDDDGEN